MSHFVIDNHMYPSFISPLRRDVWSPHLVDLTLWARSYISHVTKKIRYISTSTKPMTAKIDKVEVYSKGPPSIESFDLWSCDQVITWQMENVISQLLQDLWLSNLTYIKSDNLFIKWSYKVTWQMKNVIKLLSRDL